MYYVVSELKTSLVKARSKNNNFVAGKYVLLPNKLCSHLIFPLLVQLPTFQELDELFEFVKVKKFNIPVIENCSHTKTQFFEEIEKDLMLLAALRQMKEVDLGNEGKYIMLNIITYYIHYRNHIIGGSWQ